MFPLETQQGNRRSACRGTMVRRPSERQRRGTARSTLECRGPPAGIGPGANCGPRRSGCGRFHGRRSSTTAATSGSLGWIGRAADLAAAGGMRRRAAGGTAAGLATLLRLVRRGRTARAFEGVVARRLACLLLARGIARTGVVLRLLARAVLRRVATAAGRCRVRTITRRRAVSGGRGPVTLRSLLGPAGEVRCGRTRILLVLLLQLLIVTLAVHAVTKCT